jgi:hypothetical protein
MSTLHTDPDSLTVSVGEEFHVLVMLDGQETVNAAQVNLSWPEGILDVDRIDYTASAMPVLAESVVMPGEIRMARSLAGGTPLISGLQLFADIVFVATYPGQATVHFDDTCAVIDPTQKFQNVLTTRTDGVFTIQDEDGPPAPPLNIQGEITMPYQQSGAEIRVTGTEANTNADGSALNDLQKTLVSYDIGAGPVVGADIPATSPQGGGPIDATFIIPVGPGTQTNVSLSGVSVDLVGNVSVASPTVILTIDTLAPAPPSI